MRVTLIAALDRHRAIGRDNTMPWHLPDDFRHFKTMTVGKPVVMGYRTAVSIGRALPDRPNIVLSRSRPAPFEGQLAARSLNDALAVAGEIDPRSDMDLEVMIAGGGQVYELALPLATDLRLTLVDTAIEAADTFFPDWGSGWREVERTHHGADIRHAYAFDWIRLVR